VIDDAFTGQVKCTVIATGFVEKDLPPMQAMAPAQRIIQSNFSRPNSSNARQETVRQSQLAEPGMKSANADLNMEELEVPAFMRKPISK